MLISKGRRISRAAAVLLLLAAPVAGVMALSPWPASSIVGNEIAIVPADAAGLGGLDVVEPVEKATAKPAATTWTAEGGIEHAAREWTFTRGGGGGNPS